MLPNPPQQDRLKSLTLVRSENVLRVPEQQQSWKQGLLKQELIDLIHLAVVHSLFYSWPGVH